jgi:hypothetical protein
MLPLFYVCSIINTRPSVDDGVVGRLYASFGRCCSPALSLPTSLCVLVNGGLNKPTTF